ncbi:hypothetical protein ACIQV3_22480 [Streptomyces sp. NPDC099050]|uniref:hypothetical protein n=1 Tax=Streptomyces sp. NPDC099050 TaxID=3366100 RepID=UPI0037F78680
MLDTEYAPADPRPDITCHHCQGRAEWIDCPTGGWWAHHTHPADGHDATPAA